MWVGTTESFISRYLSLLISDKIDRSSFAASFQNQVRGMLYDARGNLIGDANKEYKCNLLGEDFTYKVMPESRSLERRW
jgi:hypothetical protein